MTDRLILPRSSWADLTKALLGLKLGSEQPVHSDDIAFLRQLGYLNDESTLTPEGLNICTLVLVRDDTAAVAEINHRNLLLLPATQALLQALWGLKDISVDQARMALVFAGLDQEEAEKNLVNFLSILNGNGIITYSRKNRTVRLLVSPKEMPASPPHIYIDRSRPYSNDVWIREILRECRGSILWLDKYFQKEAFEWIWREANGTNISQIRIVSTSDGKGSDNLAIADYRRLKKELGIKGIDLEWRALERSAAHDFHDRWVLDEVDVCYNLPSVGSIKSGQRSELHRSPHHKQIKQVFDEYFDAASPVT